MSVETILNSLGAVSLILGFTYTMISMHVLHFSELERGRFEGWIQFWPFYKEMQDAYPTSSRAGRLSVIWGFAFAVPWVIGRSLGVC